MTRPSINGVRVGEVNFASSDDTQVIAFYPSTRSTTAVPDPAGSAIGAIPFPRRRPPHRMLHRSATRLSPRMRNDLPEPDPEFQDSHHQSAMALRALARTAAEGSRSRFSCWLRRREAGIRFKDRCRAKRTKGRRGRCRGRRAGSRRRTRRRRGACPQHHPDGDHARKRGCPATARTTPCAPRRRRAPDPGLCEGCSRASAAPIRRRGRVRSTRRSAASSARAAPA